jgi:hypothetical protein
MRTVAVGKPKSAVKSRRGKSRIPTFATIEEEAEFWDTHDTAEFEDEFEVVEDIIFVRAQPKKSLTVQLGVDELESLKREAREKGVSASPLVRVWIVEHLRRGNVRSRRAKPRSPETGDSGRSDIARRTAEEPAIPQPRR